MELVPNEMLQDSAILMTSKNPSLSRQKSYVKCARPRHSPGVDKVMKPQVETVQKSEDVALAETVSAAVATAAAAVVTEPAPSTSANGRTKPKTKTPRKKKAKSPRTEPQAETVLQEAAALLAQTVPVASDSDAGQENRSPAKKARKERNRRQSAKSNNNSPPVAAVPVVPPAATPSAPPNLRKTGASPKSSGRGNTSRPPLATNLGNLANPQPPMHNVRPQVQPFRRPWPVSANLYPQHRFNNISDLNPFARTFFPRVYSKPGASNEYVSREIYEYYLRNRQNNDQFKGKQTLRHALENTLRQVFPNHFINLYMVGSSTNGIGDNPSAVDICIMARKRIKASRPFGDVENNPSILPATNAVGDSTNATPAETSTTTEPQDEKMEQDPIASSETENADQPKQARDEKMKKEEDPVVSSEAANAEQQSKQEDDKEKSSEETSNEAENADQTKPNEEEKMEQDPGASSEAEKPKEDVLVDEANEPELTLAMIEAVLQQKNFAKDIVFIPAKVPIIKFKDDIAKLDITLNLNQDVSIRNTQLIRDYAKMDWRFPYLAMVLKQWARENNICSAIDKTISSYSWTLMVVHFLQVCEPPVLPALQKMVPRRYDQRISVEQTINNWRRYPAKWRSANTSNLRQLLKGLFRYYGYVFSYDQRVISIREGKLLDRVAVQARAHPNDNQWNAFLCIEEPFTRSNTTRSVHDKEKFERIIELFRMSSNALRGVRISLFNVIADDIDFPINYRK